jgi:hypothetical protein
MTSTKSLDDKPMPRQLKKRIIIAGVCDIYRSVPARPTRFILGNTSGKAPSLTANESTDTDSALQQ